MHPSPFETAHEVLEVVPVVMRAIRTEMRRRRAPDLSVPQFRTLGFVNRHPGTSLSDVAEFIGLTLPAMSKLVDGLVERKLVTREIHAGDRRRVTLDLTRRGRTCLQAAHDSAQASLAARFAPLDAEERSVIVRALEILYPLFAVEGERSGHVHS
jgi:DNA-binding MarR family transcriptional regulator